MGQVYREIKLLHLNINGIYSSRAELEHLLTEHDPHITCLNETHLHISNKLNINNYNIYRKDRIGIKGGVAILHRKDIPVTEIDIPTEHRNIEALIIKIQIHNWPLYICTLYNPPGKPIPVKFLKHLNTYDKIILVTDINAHHPLLGDDFTATNKAGRDLVAHLKHSKFHQIYTPGPTRIPQTNNQQFTTPDKILATIPVSNRIQNIQILSPINSDHLPLLVTIATPTWTPITTNTLSETYNYSKADWNIFREELDKHITITYISNTQDIDQADNTLLKAITQARETAIPKKKTHSMYNRKRTQLPEHIIKLIHVKRRAFRLYKRTNTDSDRRLFRSLQEDVKNSIRNFRNYQYMQYTQQINNTQTDNTKRFWKHIKKIQNKTHKPNLPLKVNGKIIFADESKAEVFKQHFQKVFQPNTNPNTDMNNFNTVNNFIEEHKVLYLPTQTIVDSQTGNTIYTLITPKDIINTIRKSRNTAPGPDNIPNTILKNLTLKAIIFLSQIFTASLITGHLPQRWKEAHILVFPKSGKKNDDVNNYRPISLTNTISKLLEKIIVNKLETILTNIIPRTQAGFRPNTEITDQILTVLTPIEHAANKKHYSIITALDIRKAFDTMWHNGLRYKLTHQNFPPNITRWISHFLHNRKAQIKINNTLSNKLTLLAGAPQGSTISPTLYNIYVHDIPQPHTPNIGLAQYADDTCFWVTAPQLRQASKSMNNTLQKYLDWANKWLISINTEKTQTMAIKRKMRTRHQLHKHPIIIDKQIIPYQHKVTYLGITVTDKLKLTKHLQTTHKKLQAPINTISFLSHKNSKCTPKTLITLYKTLVRPIITFAAPVLLLSTASDLKKFQRIERKVFRKCLKLPRYASNTTTYTLANTKHIDEIIHTNCINYYKRAQTRENYKHIFENPPPNTIAHKLKKLAEHGN